MADTPERDKEDFFYEDYPGESNTPITNSGTSSVARIGSKTKLSGYLGIENATKEHILRIFACLPIIKLFVRLHGVTFSDANGKSTRLVLQQDHIFDVLAIFQNNRELDAKDMQELLGESIEEGAEKYSTTNDQVPYYIASMLYHTDDDFQLYREMTEAERMKTSDDSAY
jgi:hypothetical protein